MNSNSILSNPIGSSLNPIKFFEHPLKSTDQIVFPPCPMGFTISGQPKDPDAIAEAKRRFGGFMAGAFPMGFSHGETPWRKNVGEKPKGHQPWGQTLGKNLGVQWWTCEACGTGGLFWWGTNGVTSSDWTFQWSQNHRWCLDMAFLRKEQKHI